MDSSKEMKNENFVYNNDDKNMLDDFKNEIIKIINYFDKANQLELIEKEKLINENSELEVFCIKSKRDDSKIIIRYPKLLSKIFLLSQKDINFFINEITNELHKIIYTPPFPIFGRMKIYSQYSTKKESIRDINYLFYEGFELDIK